MSKKKKKKKGSGKYPMKKGDMVRCKTVKHKARGVISKIRQGQAELDVYKRRDVVRATIPLDDLDRENEQKEEEENKKMKISNSVR